MLGFVREQDPKLARELGLSASRSTGTKDVSWVTRG
jgi:hypothetical protein